MPNLFLKKKHTLTFQCEEDPKHNDEIQIIMQEDIFLLPIN
jgi:hypothetical protein